MDNKDWCRKAASYVVTKKGWKYETYIKKFFVCALEPVGIHIWARCFRRHVAMFVNTYFWTTHKENDLEKCEIFLVYRGYNMFEDTRIMKADEYNLYTDAIARTQAIMDERDLQQNVKDMHSSYLKRVERIVSDDEDYVDLEEVMEQTNTRFTRSMKKKHEYSNMQKAAAASVSSEDEPLKDKESDQSSEESSEPPANEVVSEDNMQKNPPPSPPANSQSDVSEQDNNMQKNRTDDSPPSPPAISDNEKPEKENNNRKNNDVDEGYASNQEPESETKDEKSVEREDQSVEREDQSSNKKQKLHVPETSDADVKPKIKPKSSCLKAANKIVNNIKAGVRGSWHRASKNRKKEKSLLHNEYNCSDKTCKVVKGSKIAMLKHIREAHKEYRFHCRHCTRKYQSLAGRNKHELYHKVNYRYVCKEVSNCSRGFMFLCEYIDHLKVHTQKNLWKCRYKGCDKRYAAKRTATAHYKTHFAQDVLCDEKLEDGTICGQSCVSDNHLAQHK